MQQARAIQQRLSTQETEFVPPWLLVPFGRMAGRSLPGIGRYIHDLPTTFEPGGSPVMGRVRSKYIMGGEGNDTLPASVFTLTRGHSTVSLNTTQA